MAQELDNGQFKKGQVPWNKGKQGVQVNLLKGKKMPTIWRNNLKKPKSIKRPQKEETKIKISNALKGKYLGKDHSNWKGGKSVLQNKVRRERMKNIVGSHTKADWELLKKQYGFTCPCCHKSEPEIKITEDHIIPVAKGGSDFIENIQPLCFRCNTKKHTKVIKYELIWKN